MNTLPTFGRLIALYQDDKIEPEIVDVENVDFEPREKMKQQVASFVNCMLTEYPALFVTATLDRIIEFATEAKNTATLKNQALNELVALLPEDKTKGSSAVIYGDKFTFRETPVYEIPEDDAILVDLNERISKLKKEMEPFTVKMTGFQASVKARTDALKAELTPVRYEETLAISKK